MATCASCGKEMRDDDWTCGHCGAPVKEAGATGGAGASPRHAPTTHSGVRVAARLRGAGGLRRAGGAPGGEGGLSRSTLTIVIVAALAVVAIIAVWFFFVRGARRSSPFLGTWNEPDGGIDTVEIKLKGGDFKVTMTGKDAAGQKTSRSPRTSTVRVWSSPSTTSSRRAATRSRRRRRRRCSRP